MNIRTVVVLLSLSAVLAGCGGAGGVHAPKEVAGTWGADCAQPFVKFDGSKITIFPDKATYDLKSAELANGQLTVAYESPQGAMSEVYILEGATLRLDHGTYGGTEATWHKMPMNKCG